MIEVAVKNSKVVLFEDKDLRFPYDSRTEPNYTYNFPSKYAWVTIGCDTYPGFAHDIDLVCEEVLKLPFDIPTTFFLTPHEVEGRTNGYATYSHGDNDSHHHYVVLSGKRIPIMPSMTRYLVAHEYGHVFENWLTHDLFPPKPEIEFRTAYARLRGVEHVESQSEQRTWPRRTCEYIANDFRLLMTDAEHEFWPHPAPRPEKVLNKGFHNFWNQFKDKAADKTSYLGPHKFLPTEPQ